MATKKISKHLRLSEYSIECLKQITFIENNKRIENNLNPLPENEILDMIISRDFRNTYNQEAIANRKKVEHEFLFNLIKELFKKYDEKFINSLNELHELTNDETEWLRLICAASDSLNQIRIQPDLTKKLIDNYNNDPSTKNSLLKELEVKNNG